VRNRLLFQNVRCTQQHGFAYDMWMEPHKGRKQIGAVGVSNERSPFRINTVGNNRTFDKSLESLGLRPNVLLVEPFQIETAKPALNAFFRAASPNTQKRCARCSQTSKRHEVVFIAAGAM